VGLFGEADPDRDKNHQNIHIYRTTGDVLTSMFGSRDLQERIRYSLDNDLPLPEELSLGKWSDLSGQVADVLNKLRVSICVLAPVGCIFTPKVDRDDLDSVLANLLALAENGGAAYLTNDFMTIPSNGVGESAHSSNDIVKDLYSLFGLKEPSSPPPSFGDGTSSGNGGVNTYTVQSREERFSLNADKYNQEPLARTGTHLQTLSNAGYETVVAQPPQTGTEAHVQEEDESNGGECAKDDSRGDCKTSG
jgi:hypothetical protein